MILSAAANGKAHSPRGSCASKNAALALDVLIANQHIWAPFAAAGTALMASRSTTDKPARHKPPLYALCIGAAVFGATVFGASVAWAAVALAREPAEGELRLGQRVRVDDGTCPAGQVKEVTASKLTPQGISRSRVCVKR